MPKLLVKFNAAVIQELDITGKALSVGRKADNDIVIDNPAVSGHHCRIAMKGDTYFVEDLESTNGTYVNEKRIVKAAGLHHEDTIGIAKHAIVFLEDKPAAPAPAPVPEEKEPEGDGTMVMSADQMKNMAKSSMANAPKQKETVGVLKVLKGIVDKEIYELKGLSTYIGKSDRVQIPIKGSGLFGSAPEVAASIHKKPDGYVLVAVKEGYPVINGNAVTGQQGLRDGDIIECGNTTLQFFLRSG